MADVVYGDGLYYGDGSLYGTGIGASIDTPQNLQYYRTNVEGIYTFHWSFNQGFISPSLSTLDWELDLDKVPTFDSPDFISFNKTTSNIFQNGNAAKGFEVSVFSRMENTTQFGYARVRTINGLSVSDWSDTIQFSIPPLLIETEAENLLNNVPDSSVYNKDILNGPPSQRNTILYSVYFKDLATHLDALRLQLFLTSQDTFIRLGRDESLYDNFGIFFNFQKPIDLTNVEYRRCLENLITASLEGGTIDALNQVVRSFTGVDPTIVYIRDTIAFILVNSSSESDLTYLDSTDPAVLVDQRDAAFGVIIHINNPGGFTLDIPLITTLLKLILPSYVKFFITT